MYKQTEDPSPPESPNSQPEDQPQNQYGSASYWQHRYKKTKGQRFDWLQSYTNIKHLITQQFGQNKNIKILNIGCGNGQLQDHLYNDGYKNIYNNDISKEVIDQMQQIKKQKNQSTLVYEVMDVREMTYPGSYFDAVIDKSTIDALLCSDNPYINTSKMLEQVSRVLKAGGLYLIISYAPPENRLKHLRRENVDFQINLQELVRVSEDGGKLVHYAYICKNCKQEEGQQQGHGGETKVKRSAEWKKQFYERLKKEEMQDYGDAE